MLVAGGIVEIPSYVLTWYAMDRLGRRWVLCLTMLLGGLACVSCMFVPEGNVSSIYLLSRVKYRNKERAICITLPWVYNHFQIIVDVSP